MQEVAGERGGYLHGRGALDSDDLLYLKEQMEAEEDAERLLRRTEKRAFAAFKRAASVVDSSPAVPLPLRVEPKPKSGIRQHDILKNVLEVRPKRSRVSSPSDGVDAAQKVQSTLSTAAAPAPKCVERIDPAPNKDSSPIAGVDKAQVKPELGNTAGSLLGLTYESSDEE